MATATATQGVLKAIPRQGGDDRDGPITSVAFGPNGCRPGYAGPEEPASAPDFLDFAKTATVLKDLPEEAFRKAFVDALLAVDDLGLNRGKGKPRANAYLDMVTWDANIRTGWKNDNSSGTSSCGMFVRNIWWLCGARGTPLFDAPYKPTKTTGVLSDLLKFDSKASKGWGSGFTAKTFFPKIGDVFYLYSAATNSQHIFILCDIDKKIVDVDGQATALNEDGTPASVITFTSVDGGQLDGVGPDENGASKTWGCQGIHKSYRKMKLKDGHFPSVGTAWPFPDREPGRPIVTWISIWEARDKFTAPLIKPVRLGPIGISASGGAPIKKVDPLDDSAAPVDFYTWPKYTSPVPKSILDKVAANRKAVPVTDAFSTFYVTPEHGEKTPTGYSYVPKDKEKNKPPKAVCTPEEIAAPHLQPILERLQKEMSGEGYVSSVLTGDGAHFTWGRGLGHKGGLEPAFFEFISKDAQAKRDFLDCGITLEKDVWKIVDLASDTVQVGDSAIDLLNGFEPAAEKKLLLSVFIGITERHLESAAQAQWDSFKRQFFYGPKIPPSVISTWTPEAICYVIHCNAWGSFAGWPRFEATGGDLRKILRLEVDYTGYFDDKGSYLQVNTVRGNVTPAPTMLLNMGHECMLPILEPWKDAAEMQAKVRPGDVVFQMIKGRVPGYYGLRGTAKMFDPKDKYDIWVENHQGHPMATLIAELDKLGPKEALATRDRYVSPNNPNKGKWGPRPQIAMEAVIHKNEGITAAWLFDKCEEAGITLQGNPDQFNAVAREIGLDKYDAWVEKHQALPMDSLISEIGKLGYKETKATRDWYASDKNRKKEKWGLRPRVALDAVLHKNEGQGAAWILNECELAEISPAKNGNQYAIIKKTLGIA